MIISVDEAKRYISTTIDDKVLEAKLQALEFLIRKYTNNNFQKRTYRQTADIVGGLFYIGTSIPFAVGDTVQVSESDFNEGIYTIQEVGEGVFTVKETVIDEANVLVTKVEYPIDVVMGVVNMLNWDLNNRDKVGIQSETISRHSVTYFNMDGDNSIMGYPKSLLGFLEPYKKARF